MVETSLPVRIPQDKRYLIYLSFIVLGIGVFLPWNMLILTEPYFTTYKLGPEYLKEKVSYAHYYMICAILVAQISNVLCNWINIFIRIPDGITTRILCSSFLQVVMIILTITLAVSDTHECPGAFFSITMISIVLLNMGNGMYQNTIFGMTTKFPMEYTSAVILGSNINGIFVAVVDILSRISMSNVLLTAVYYFIIVLFILLICLANYFALPLNKYYKYSHLKEKNNLASINQSDSSNSKVPYMNIFNKARLQLFNIFFVFLVTSSLFPAVQSKVKLNDPDFWIPHQLYTSVMCFFTFYITASVGCYLTFFITRPSPKYLIYPVVARVVLIPLFLLSNYHSSNDLYLRTLPILITNDWVYWIIAIIMGVSSGYLSSLGMMYVSRMVESKYASVACMFGAAALATGFFGGVLVSFIWPSLIN